MRNGFLGSLVGLTAGAGLALAQPYPTWMPTPPGTGPYTTRYADLAAVAAGTADQPVAPGLAPAVPPAAPGVVSVKPAAAPFAPTGGCGSCASCAPSVDCGGSARGRGGRSWGDVELLLWWLKSAPVPPLVVATTGPSAGAELGDNNFRFGLIPGVRSSGGFWLDDNHTIGLESSGFAFWQQNEGFIVASDATGNPGLARPLSLGNVQTLSPLAIPGIASGGLEADAQTRLYSSDIHLLAQLSGSCRLRTYGLVGFRYLDLQEQLDVTGVTRGIAGPAVSALAVDTADRFKTRNQFYGGQLGGRAVWNSGRAWLNLTATVSLGDMQEQIQTGGTTAVITPVGTFATPGGFLVRSSNAGRGFQDEFAVIPEVGLKVGYQLNERLSVEAGYTWLYVSNVLRPGDQVGAVSPTGQPFIPFKETDFFAHGMSFGVAYRY